MRRVHSTSSCLVALAASSCFLDAAGRGDLQYGTATLPWTIQGHLDAAACDEREAISVGIVLRSEDGRTVADDTFACTAGSARYVLRDGWYQAVLTLLDTARAPVSETRDTGRFHVTAGQDTLVRTDFVAGGGAPPPFEQEGQTWPNDR